MQPCRSYRHSSCFEPCAVVDLSDNDISGTLPSKWALPSQILKLSGCQLTGTIPSSWSLPSKELWLDKNQLSGECSSPAQLLARNFDSPVPSRPLWLAAYAEYHCQCSVQPLLRACSWTSGTALLLSLR